MPDAISSSKAKLARPRYGQRWVDGLGLTQTSWGSLGDRMGLCGTCGMVTLYWNEEVLTQDIGFYFAERSCRVPGVRPAELVVNLA